VGNHLPFAPIETAPTFKSNCAATTLTRNLAQPFSSQHAQDCAHVIENTFQPPVKVASSLQEACRSLQSAKFSAVLVDQWATEAEPGQADYLIHHLGGAVPALRAALYRRGRETQLAQQNARILPRNSFKDDVTALLLSCGVILGDPTLSPGLAVRVQTIEAIANQMKERLLAEEDAAAAASGKP